ncbi:MAG: hypothetical protein OEZ14_06925, partial [Acidimicrobiia bacterium]|nr:hypothetical protein [Acidimicrobiia bacterium]
MSSARRIRALYRALLDQQLTRSRLLLILGFTVLALVLALSIGSQVDPDSRTEAIVAFLSVYGLGFMVPILSLLFASTTLGQLVEDETLVYLWLRPNPRWQLALAAWAASATIASRSPSFLWPLRRRSVPAATVASWPPPPCRWAWPPSATAACS